jgi:hypothetical protein
MSSTGDDPAADLAIQIRTELSDRAPEGFHFTDHLIRQDEALGRTAARLEAHPDRSEVERALARALDDESDRWTILKLLELVERMQLLGTAPALMKIASFTGGDERSRFLAGRACEVLLKLPLDLEARTRANALCKAPLEEVARFRRGADREQVLQRPRRIEWLLVIGLLALAMAALIFAFTALGRS